MFNSKIIGLVLDVSLRHSGEDRLIDTVKKKMVQFIREDLDGEDILYLYHPEVMEPTIYPGAQVASISNYETDGWEIDLELALKQSLFVIEAEDEGCPKYLVLITDRATNSRPLKKVCSINKRDDIGSKILVIGIGDRYRPSVVDGLDLTYRHLDSPQDLSNVLKEETN